MTYDQYLSAVLQSRNQFDWRFVYLDSQGRLQSHQHINFKHLLTMFRKHAQVDSPLKSVCIARNGVIIVQRKDAS